MKLEDRYKDQIIALRKEGLAYPDIADRLVISKNTVERIVRKNGLAGRVPKYPEALIERMAHLFKSGHSATVVADLLKGDFDLNRNKVIGILHRRGVTRNTRPRVSKRRETAPACEIKQSKAFRVFPGNVQGARELAPVTLPVLAFMSRSIDDALAARINA